MKNINYLTKNAILAALYVALTLVLAPFSFGPVQIRIATALYQLVVLDKRFYAGMVLGVFIANLFSPYGWIDCLAGLAVTGGGLAAAVLLTKNIRKLSVRCLITGICVTVPMIFVACVLKFVGNVPLPLFVIYLYVMIGQAAAQVIGYLFVILAAPHISRQEKK